MVEVFHEMKRKILELGERVEGEFFGERVMEIVGRGEVGIGRGRELEVWVRWMKRKFWSRERR